MSRIPVGAPGIRMVNGRRMQCKDIPDEVFLEAVRRSPGTPNCGWRTRWNVREVLEQEVGPVPENLFMAKARRLIARGLMDGCACGCRGDFVPAGELVVEWDRTGVSGLLLFGRAMAAGEAFEGAMQRLVTQAGESDASVAAIRNGIEKLAGLGGLIAADRAVEDAFIFGIGGARELDSAMPGTLMHSFLSEQPQQAGPPWTHAFRQPEPEEELVEGEDGEMVLVERIPLRPSFTIERRPKFTGILGFLADQGGEQR